MGITVEILTLLVRRGPDHNKFGDDYDSVATLQNRDGTVITKGTVAKSKLTLQDIRDLKRELKRLGLKLGQWDRYRGGKKRTRPNAKR